MASSRRVITVTAPSFPGPSLPGFLWSSYSSSAFTSSPVSSSITGTSAFSSTTQLSTPTPSPFPPANASPQIGPAVFISVAIIAAASMMWQIFGCWCGKCRRWVEPEDGLGIQLRDPYPLPLGLGGDDWVTIDLNDVNDGKGGKLAK